MFAWKSRNRRKEKNNFAGMALHGDSLRYLELNGEQGSLNVVRQETIPIEPGVIVKDSLVDMNKLLPTLEEFGSVLGGFHCPVALGLPSRDVILRLLDYPRMDIEDVRETLQLEFEKFFPYSFQDAQFDICEVELPDQNAEDKLFAMAAACRRHVANEFLKIGSKAGIPLSAIEPNNVAFFRAATGPAGQPGGYLIVFVEPENTHIMVGYKNNGVLFRSALVDLTTQERRESDDGLIAILRDVQNTIIFFGNQYKELPLDNLILGGVLGKDSRLPLILESGVATDVSVLDVWELWGIPSLTDRVEGFETAFGLAVRNLS
jgi:type IV pilus assembly protein PilM